jgi:hypothetical protein
MIRRWSLFLVVNVVVAAAVLATGQTPAPPSGRGLLAGQVVEAGTTRPVAGALVTLGGSPSISSSNVIFSIQQAAIPGGSRVTLTNAQGHFAFANLPSGTFSLQATKTGYSPGGYGRRRPTGAAQAITISDADRIGDLTIPLWRFATIGGTVTDEAGEPVVGISVRAMRRIFENGRPQFAVAGAGMTAETDDRGAYRLTTLIPGEYMLAITSTQTTVPQSLVEAYRKASSAGTALDIDRELRASDSPTLGSMTSGMLVGDHFFQSSAFASRVLTPPAPTADGKVSVYPMQFYPNAMSEAQATVVTLRAGEDRLGLDMHLKPVATTRVSGTVTGPSGPAANLGLSLVPAATSLLSDRFFETATTVTDSRGVFVFLGVPAGQYIVRTLRTPVLPSGSPSTLTTVVQTGTSTLFTGSTAPDRPAVQIPAGPTLWAQVPVTVDDSDVKGVNISLQTGFRIGGQFAFDAATRPEPIALRRLIVTFEPVDGRISSLTVTRGHVDDAGRLSSYELPPGKYYVRVQGSIPGGGTFKSAVTNGADVSDVPLDLRANVADLVLTYTDHPSTLGGTVRTVAGAPDQAAQVLAFPVDAAASDFAGAPRRLRSARASRSGAYQIIALPPGEYFVVAVADETAADFPSFTLIRSLVRQATRIRIGDDEKKTQDLTTVRTR